MRLSKRWKKEIILLWIGLSVVLMSGISFAAAEDEYLYFKLECDKVPTHYIYNKTTGQTYWQYGTEVKLKEKRDDLDRWIKMVLDRVDDILRLTAPMSK